MFLEKPLQQLGLTEKQAKVYLALLELGVDSVANIAKKAEVKRPTAYLIIEELLQRGLVSKAPKSKGNKYIAENPENFKNILEQNKKALDNALPFLRAMHVQEKNKPQVKIYEGAESVEQVYYNTIWKAKSEILFFSAIKKLYEVMPEAIEEWVKFTQKSQDKIHTREIIDNTPIDLKYARRALKNNQNLNIRILPKDFKHSISETDNAIFDDKVMFVSFKDKLFTTVIQSEGLASSMRTLFELAWQSAIPAQKYLKQ